MIKIPELLVPVGGQEQLRAAVACGADAVYMGGAAFNARMNADNFSAEELSAAIDMAHEYGVRVHITENTLIKNGELAAAAEHAVRMYECGADALIVQDRGLADILKSVIPDMPLHLSTQGTVYNSAGVIEAEKAGFSRVILSRELSYEEIRKICTDTSAEIEIFVHGAVCICYSGQCHMSYFLGGRSGNRGVCAQPCRLPYSLSDGKKTSGYNYLLSPSDMCLLPHLRAIAEAGVHSLKIEGRMKSPEYVAAVTSVYRKYLDELKLSDSNYLKSQSENFQQDIKMLRQVFNRGDFTDAYFKGESGGSLMSGDTPKHRGVKIGELISCDKKRGHAVVRLSAELANGDGVEIRDGKENVGNIITYIKKCNDLKYNNTERHKSGKHNAGQKNSAVNKKSEYNIGKTELIAAAAPGMVVEIGDLPALYNIKNLKSGADVYKITDKALMKSLGGKYEKLPHRISVNFRFNAEPGKKAVLTACVYDASMRSIGSIIPIDNDDEQIYNFSTEEIRKKHTDFNNIKANDYDKESVTCEFNEQYKIKECKSSIDNAYLCNNKNLSEDSADKNIDILGTDISSFSADECYKNSLSEIGNVCEKCILQDFNEKSECCICVSVASDNPLEKAVKKPADEGLVKKQLAKTGGTPYNISSYTIELNGSPMISASELNNMRRSVLNELTALRINAGKRDIKENQWKSLYSRYFDINKSTIHTEGVPNSINIINSSLKDISSVDKTKISIYFHETYDQANRIRKFASEIADFRKIRENVRLFIPYGLLCSETTGISDILQQNIKIVPYISEITKGISGISISQTADKLIGLYKKGSIEGVSIGHFSQLYLFRECPLFFDESMNLYNRACVYYGIRNGMISGLLSHELDIAELAEFQETAGVCEAAVYGRTQLMVTEHCPVGSMEGAQECTDASKKHYCRQGSYSLKDKKGNVFPVICDDSVCRAKIISHKRINRLKDINKIKSFGINNLRVYVLDENPEDIFSLDIFD